jgi:hypothetical protein
MQVGGAFGSGTSIGQGISGKDMFTGEDLSAFDRGFHLTFGAAGAALDLGGAGLTLKNAGQSFPTLTKALVNQARPTVTPKGMSTQTGAVRLGGDGESFSISSKQLTKNSLRANLNQYSDNKSGGLIKVNPDVVFSGHGEFVPGNGITVVPNGTSITFYSPFGGTITNRLGNAIETGAELSKVFKRTYKAGDKLPNYSLLPPDETIPLAGKPRTVEETLLRKLLEPDMGHCHWAACTYNEKSQNRNLSFDTEGILNSEWYQYIKYYDK